MRIEGIHCQHCVDTIRGALLSLPGVEKVDLRGKVASLRGRSLPENAELVQAVRGVGYGTKESWIGRTKGKLGGARRYYEPLLIAAAILLLVFGLNKALGFNLFRAIPVIEEKLSWGMLFVTGLLTGLHCVSMCGAIGLSVSAGSASAQGSGGGKLLFRPLLYNGGRVLSYSLLGGLAGAFGSVLNLSQTARGVLISAAGLLMLVMSFSMMGWFRLRLPHLPLPGRGLRLGPFFAGLLNGLMPCGPLQSMQVYALSTGSFLRGALSMLLFGLGTVPLMLLGGTALHLAKGKARIAAQKAASALVLVLAAAMLYRGALAFGLAPARLTAREDDFLYARQDGAVQTVAFDLQYDSYADLAVRKGIPVRLVIRAEANKLTGCNNELLCPALGFSRTLTEGENVIEFTPEKAGDYTYTCWMNMLHNTIRVLDDGREP